LTPVHVSFLLFLAVLLIRTAQKADAANARPFVELLGTAQDAGSPQIAAHLPEDDAARRDPARRRLVSSLLIADPASGKRWLIDATPDLREQVERADAVAPLRSAGTSGRPPLFETIFLTHAHMGHVAG